MVRLVAHVPDAVLTPELFLEVFGVATRIAPGLVLELPR